ncbi:hypothetical protein AL536_02020 [Vibrio fluvialis]|uniref:Uncharacterized protein n=1 Tax=Vibrio fluvialis TaxID=676 RepID=A0ABM5XH95_VIBFL|nr:hypothetical protein AL536_02020 [Vibrio fluvialis]EKO3982092.1 hypothetical protein [Vibrio fluvialis]EKO4009382.1 hypothetical protein [Vibrio fluvialis]
MQIIFRLGESRVWLLIALFINIKELLFATVMNQCRNLSVSTLTQFVFITQTLSDGIVLYVR